MTDIVVKPVPYSSDQNDIQVSDPNAPADIQGVANIVFDGMTAAASGTVRARVRPASPRPRGGGGGGNIFTQTPPAITLRTHIEAPAATKSLSTPVHARKLAAPSVSRTLVAPVLSRRLVA